MQDKNKQKIKGKQPRKSAGAMTPEEKAAAAAAEAAAKAAAKAAAEAAAKAEEASLKSSDDTFSDSDDSSYDSDAEDAAESAQAGAAAAKRAVKKAKAAETASAMAALQAAAASVDRRLSEPAVEKQPTGAPSSSAAPAAAAGASTVRELTEGSELQQLLDDSQRQRRLVLACFSADWCRPCVVFAPKLALLARKFHGVAFVKLNVDKLPDVSSEYKVRAVPTFLLFSSGSQVGCVAAASKPSIELMLLNNGAVPAEGFKEEPSKEPSTKTSHGINPTKGGAAK